MQMPEKERMVSYYADLYDKYGYDWRSLDWKDPAGQKTRYEILSSMIEKGDKKRDISILDIGSGLGHFYGYLKEQGLLTKCNIDYTGYDINSKLVEAAKKKYPEVKFAVKDILEGYFAERFDYVFLCGVFNIKFSDEAEHLAFVKEMLLRSFESSKIGMAVNFLSVNGIYYIPGKDLEQPSIYYYFKPEDIIEYLRSFGGRYILRHDYHPGDFTVYLFKDKR